MQRAHRLAIGTVQFGLDYGISNRGGRVSSEAAERIVAAAIAAGVSTFDTAALYGDAEQVLAAALGSVPHVRSVTKTISLSSGLSAVLERARLSASRLGASSSLLVHAASDLWMEDGPALWRELLQLREKGYFARIGISAYFSDNPAMLAERFLPDLMQLPISVLDQRLLRDGTLAKLKSLGIEIHARSIFAQGAVFLSPSSLPPEVARIKDGLVAFLSKTHAHGISPLQAALDFPLSIPELDRVVIGVTSEQELNEILAQANDARSGIPWPEFALEDCGPFDPRTWKKPESDSHMSPVVLAILQARMSSTRLPGKVLRPIDGRPMLGRQIDRLKRSKKIDRLVVATSTSDSDDPIAAFCAAEGVDCFRGPLADVLARFGGAAAAYGPADHIVRLTGDCPLADPETVDRVIALQLESGSDYSSNIIPPTFPDGLDIEVMTVKTLDQAVRDAGEPSEREHVTQFIYRRPERFKLSNLANTEDLSKLRWTVDTEADFRMVEAVFKALLPRNPAFGFKDIREFLFANPSVAAINAPRKP